MTEFDTKLIDVVNEYWNDYGADAVLEDLLSDMTIGDVILEMYNAGFIPNDVLERFLND